jgi:hypothetical protein
MTTPCNCALPTESPACNRTQEFGARLKQDFGWLVDVIVFGCLGRLRQVSRLFDTQFCGGSIFQIVVLTVIQRSLSPIGGNS